MKKIRLYISVMLIGITLQACIDEFGGVGEPFNRATQLQGTWSISMVKQVDEIARERGYPMLVQEMDLTDLFPYQEYQISFTVDENGNPFGFSVQQGNAPSIIPFTQGTWDFDDRRFPSKILFTSPIQETYTLELNALNELTGGKMSFRYSRYSQDAQGRYKPFLSYQYFFSKMP
jgi:hypothetical protein